MKWFVLTNLIEHYIYKMEQTESVTVYFPPHKEEENPRCNYIELQLVTDGNASTI
jgi:hypothetical protein